MIDGWVWTDHARQRAAERLGDLDPDIELASARRVGHGTKRKIRSTCPVEAEKYMKGFAGRYFLMSRREVVFVIAAPNVVLTVFMLRAKDDQRIVP